MTVVLCKLVVQVLKIDLKEIINGFNVYRALTENVHESQVFIFCFRTSFLVLMFA